MNYKFHVGDYVGFTDGNGKHTGYVISYYNYPITKVHSFTFKFDDGTYFGWSGNIDDLPRNITRIGTYDFTKKEKKKIMRLSEDDSWLTFRNTNKVNVNLCYIIRRINELVDAVNELRDKEDNE